MIRKNLMDPWRDSLISELRTRELSGDRIGQALADVDAYCADSGQTPADAFGDPIAYAQQLIEAHAPERKSFARRILLPTATSFASLVGILGLLDGVDGLVHGTPAEVTAGQVTAVVLGTALFPVIATVLLSSTLSRRRWLQGLVILPAMWSTMLPLILWKTPVAHVPAGALLTGGLFFLAVAWWPTASTNLLADRIIDPRTGTEPFKLPRVALAIVRWFLPALLLIAVGVTILFP
jgi:hypothetical protein